MLNGNISYEKVFWKPPLYTYFIAFIRLFTGKSILAFLVVQNLLGACNCVLLYLLAEKLFNRGVALAAALIMVFYGTLLFSDSTVLAAALSLAWSLCLLLALVYWQPGSRKRTLLLPGVLSGLENVNSTLPAE